MVESSNFQAAISIIIPIYNAEKYILRCLESLQQQTLENIEIICIDDGSTDTSTDIIERFAQAEGRCKLIRQSNSGAGAARKRGVYAASGQYIGFVDSDDYVDSGYFEKLYTAAIANNADVVATSDSFLVYEDGRLEKHPMFHFSKKRNLSKEERYHIFYMSGVMWNKIYKRDFLLSILDYYIESDLSCEDVSLTIAACFFPPIFSTITDARYFYFQSPSSFTRRKKERQDVVDYYTFYTRLARLFEERGTVAPDFFLALKKRKILDTWYCLQHLSLGQQVLALIDLRDCGVFFLWLYQSLKSPYIRLKKMLCG